MNNVTVPLSSPLCGGSSSSSMKWQCSTFMFPPNTSEYTIHHVFQIRAVETPEHPLISEKGPRYAVAWLGLLPSEDQPSPSLRQTGCGPDPKPLIIPSQIGRVVLQIRIHGLTKFSADKDGTTRPSLLDLHATSRPANQTLPPPPFFHSFQSLWAHVAFIMTNSHRSPARHRKSTGHDSLENLTMKNS